MDDADRADRSMAVIMQDNLEHAHKDEVLAEFTGFCLYCEEPMSDPGRRWCDAQCRDDWQLENMV